MYSISFICVAFGQAAWSETLALLASLVGYALFWNQTASIDSPKRRFLIGTLWYGTVQMVQLSWFISHPYSYIYALWFILSYAMGAQLGFITSLITLRRLSSLRFCLAIAGTWSIMEWLRLFVLSGQAFNPTGMALAANLYTLQTASLWGVFGMTFWVILTNLFALKAWINRNLATALSFATIALIPYAYGAYQLQTQNIKGETAQVLLVQTNFPAEEGLGHKTMEEKLSHVFGEWVHILKLLQPHKDQNFDLVALPEATVPYGTYYPIYRYDDVKEAFETFFGTIELPPLQPHLAMKVPTSEGHVTMVNNAYWAQALANHFNTPLVIGLEDAEQGSKFYLSAFAFYPHTTDYVRYDKQVLLPMGEYIPFSFCRSLAAKYGVGGSFTPGSQPKVFKTNKGLAGLSICYEELFGDLMRHNKRIGAQMLVNLTSDVWYPHSRLPLQHFEHARLRTVEMGIPLIRACNTGITGAIDSLGRTVAILQAPDGEVEDISDTLEVAVNTHHYSTLYALTGDMPTLLFSAFCILSFLIPVTSKKYFVKTASVMID